jgi:hypothetical protein
MLTKSSCTDRETASGAADRISLSPSFMRSPCSPLLGLLGFRCGRQVFAIRTSSG